MAQTRVVIAFGDSITWGFGDGNARCPGDPNGPPRAGGYPPRLTNRLGDSGIPNEIRNEGACGEVTAGGVTRLPTVLEQNPDTDVVVIMEGTNDISDRDISTESMRANIATMVQTALDAEIWPVLASPIPRSPEAAGSNDRAGFLTSLIREDAMEAGIDFANPFNDMIDIVDLYDRFYADPYHPNAAGYGLLTDILEPATVAALDR
ncbi:MAG: GDSL-type esterase/lipase family protein, partial [Acidobacteriota bacterium]